MLVLSRKAGESIVLPDLGITITVLSIESKHGEWQARLGVDAPPDIAVHRWEIHERIKREEAERGT